MYAFVFTIIVILIFTNAITDAPNAIATLVGTKVMPFKKAARLSAIFNCVGIIVMSFVNISVANCISSIVDLRDYENGMIVLVCGMIAVIVFALVAMKFGIPTSETHGLIAGLTGSAVAIFGWKSVRLAEWKNVLIGLIWSVFGTLLVGSILSKLVRIKMELENKKIEKWQIVGCCGMSFMHGAQDGQKFIGILILFFSLVRNVAIPEMINPLDYTGIIIYTAFIMGMGISIGGKKIVDNIGSQMVELNQKQALTSDITTIATLLIASLTGMPVSTTHVKTLSIIGVAKNENTKINQTKILDICKAWFLNFPISAIIGYILAILIKNIS